MDKDAALVEGFFQVDHDDGPFIPSINGRSPPCRQPRSNQSKLLPIPTPTPISTIVDDRSPSTPTTLRGNPIKNGKGENKGRPSTPGRGKQNNSQRSPEQQEISPSSLPTNQRLRLSDNSPSNA